MTAEGAILRSLDDTEGLERALGRREAVIYRHLPGRWQGFMAIGQVRRFALDHPDLPVYVVRDPDDEPVAEALTRRLGVPSDAPQAILVRHGEAVWRASRDAVRYQGLESAVRRH